MNLDLKKFMIFDSSEGQDEGREGDKLLYHWSKDAGNNGKIEINEQIDDICLCDASLGASSRLSSGLEANPTNERNLFTSSQNSSQLDPNETIPSTTSRYLILTLDSTVIVMLEVEPESSIWIAVHVSQVHSVDVGESIAAANAASHLDPDCIPTNAIRQIINNIYARFCLINGTFQMLSSQYYQTKDQPKSKPGRSAVKCEIRAICDSYFNNVLPEIHLGSIISNIASLYNHITYLDLNPLTLMKVVSFINHIVCIDPGQIRHTIAIFNDQLLWSSLNSHDTRLVYNYMIGVLIRGALQEELSRETEKVRRIIEGMPIHLTEPHETLEGNLTTLKIEDETVRKLSKFYLTVFRSSNNMTLGLVFRDSNQPDLIQKCEQILTSDSRLGVIPLASLAKSVGQSFLKATAQANTSSQSQSSQQGAMSSASSARRRSQSGGSLTLLKSSIPLDQKYLCLDRLDLSISSSFSMEAPTRDYNSAVEGYNNDTGSSRKTRLVRHIIDLEPEMQQIQRITGRRVEEYLVKTISDSWLTVMNSKYRCIYSLYKMRNAGLNEAQQAANNLKITLVSSRPLTSGRKGAR